MDKKIIVEEIEWDTEDNGDAIDSEDLGLPKTVEINNEDLYDEIATDPVNGTEDLIDYLSDEYGYCVMEYGTVKLMIDGKLVCLE